jgi:hypothetical protein
MASVAVTGSENFPENFMDTGPQKPQLVAAVWRISRGEFLEHDAGTICRPALSDTFTGSAPKILLLR